MSVSTTRYVRKALHVDAVRVTEGNFEEIAAWCQGDIRTEDADGERYGKRYIKIRVHNPKNPRQTKAFTGDWLLYTEKGYKVYVNKAFMASFEELDTLSMPIAYPYSAGETTVIGPECFAQRDGSLLNWRGQNYILQPDPDQIKAQDGTDGNSRQEEPAAERAA
jgi:hypothetical protein